MFYEYICVLNTQTITIIMVIRHFEGWNARTYTKSACKHVVRNILHVLQENMNVKHGHGTEYIFILFYFIYSYQSRNKIERERMSPSCINNNTFICFEECYKNMTYENEYSTAQPNTKYIQTINFETNSNLWKMKNFHGRIGIVIYPHVMIIVTHCVRIPRTNIIHPAVTNILYFIGRKMSISN